MPQEPEAPAAPDLSARSALYSTVLADEVRLNYIFDGGAHHADTGKPGHAYYSRDHYFARQAAHGVALYPDPQPAK